MSRKGRMQHGTKTEFVVKAYDHARIEADKKGNKEKLAYRPIIEHMQLLEDGSFPEVMEIDTSKKWEDQVVARRWGKLISAALRKHRPENTSHRRGKGGGGSRKPKGPQKEMSWAVPPQHKTAEPKMNMADMTSFLQDLVERLEKKKLLVHDVSGREVNKAILETVYSRL